MGVVHPKEPSELARKTFSGMVVMNYYPTVSKETMERVLERQRKAKQEAEFRPEQESEPRPKQEVEGEASK